MPTLLVMVLCTVGFLAVWYVVGLCLLPWFTRYEESVHPEVGKCLGEMCNPTTRESHFNKFGEMMYRRVAVKDVDYEHLKNSHILLEAKWDSVWWLFKLLALWPHLVATKSLANRLADKVRLKQLEAEKFEENARVQKYVEELREEQAREFAQLEVGRNE